MLKHHSIRRILPLTAAILLGLLAWRVGAQIATGGPILPPFSLAVPESKPLIAALTGVAVDPLTVAGLAATALP